MDKKNVKDMLVEKAENLGWSVHGSGNEFEFSKGSPAGEDFSFVATGKTLEDVIRDVRDYADSFDTEEHVWSLLNAKRNGFSGVPALKKLVEDADEIQEMLEDLASGLAELHSDEDGHQLPAGIVLIRPMEQREQKYSYAQSAQLYAQTGKIGHLRGDMDSDGNGFFTSWTDVCKNLKTDDFVKEFDNVVNALRNDPACNGILKNRESLGRFCCLHPDSKIENSAFRQEFGFRVDTERYAYLLRLNPARGEYNLYIYCYVREWLDKHLAKAEDGVRFITPDYRELFRVPDGGKVVIVGKDNPGDSSVYSVRYIDGTHLELHGHGGDHLYHICELAELLDRSKKAIAPYEVAVNTK